MIGNGGRSGGGGWGFPVLAGAAVLVLVTAACGGGTSESQAPPETQTEQEVGESGELTLVMDEFSFVPDTITVSAGQEITLTIVNDGMVEHELMIGHPFGGGPEWESDLFARMAPEVMSGDGYVLEGMEGMEEEEGEEMHGHEAAAIELESGAEVTLHLAIPADAVGEWELGCFLPQHYEAGMKGTLIVQ